MPSSSLPVASLAGRTVPRHLFGLAPAGVYRATHVAMSAVGSYSTVSPLPPGIVCPEGGLFSVALAVVGVNLCLHKLSPRPGVTWQHVQGARTFLDSYCSRDYPASYSCEI